MTTPSGSRETTERHLDCGSRDGREFNWHSSAAASNTAFALIPRVAWHDRVEPWRTRGHPSKARAILTPREFECILSLQVLGSYHNDLHAALGKSPAANVRNRHCRFGSAAAANKSPSV
jgi:hypothetical protein